MGCSMVDRVACSSSTSKSKSETFAPEELPELGPGLKWMVKKKFTQEEVQAFCDLTGDTNTLHRHGRMQDGKPRAPILPGIMCTSLFPAVIGRNFPGAVYARQQVSFRTPLQVGRTVIAEVECIRFRRGGYVEFATRCITERGNVICRGIAWAKFDLSTIRRVEPIIHGSKNKDIPSITDEVRWKW
ncbi:hypothetical protein BSKO_03009 [Bryopsis sp. KO-2023]|nr:hypothetical protein BSKO_03009 [Bryopsis sp. KO-2023]